MPAHTHLRDALPYGQMGFSGLPLTHDDAAVICETTLKSGKAGQLTQCLFHTRLKQQRDSSSYYLIKTFTLYLYTLRQVVYIDISSMPNY